MTTPSTRRARGTVRAAGLLAVAAAATLSLAAFHGAGDAPAGPGTKDAASVSYSISSDDAGDTSRTDPGTGTGTGTGTERTVALSDSAVSVSAVHTLVLRADGATGSPQ
ncbi:hypothetical protein [Streptomyces sp. NPDC002564]|uniref:hypothetical protein n=1 Tax=Streptomyces sp. NPDC002564 TaxID=3364649 RepID=UPI0036801890